MGKNKAYILIVISIVALIIGGIVGSMFFPVTKEVIIENDEGKFCYNTDQDYYVANSLDNMPEGNIDGTVCMNVNPGFSDCNIWFICPNCVTEKIGCVCKK